MSSNHLTNRPFEESLPDFGVLVAESHHSRDFAMSARSHPFVKLIYVLEGSGKLEAQLKSRPFETGDVIIIPPGLRHRIIDSPEAPTSLYVACLSLDLLHFDPSLAKQFRFTVLTDPHLTTRVAVTMRRMVYRQQSRDRGISLAMATDSLRLIETILEPKTARRKKVDRTSVSD
ncbi:MAG: AraC family ligand binding domain-containing protein, partial [Planctomycetota bacterium]